MAEKTDAERLKRMQLLSDALDAQRKQTGATWKAAAEEMHTAWVAGRNEDRRVTTKPHLPERRRR